ncbi:MAG TPA: DUF2310 family Zn-ribbon-containing protein, partial [Abditibacteriaceae bacterium]
MRSFEFDFFPRPETRGDEWGQFDDILETFLNSLSKNGNIVGQWQILELHECVQVRVLAPEDSALDEQHWNTYAREDYARILALSERPAEFRCIAEKMGKREEHPCCTCESPSAYMLFTTFLALEMPVDCFDCRRAVPLYRLPHLFNEGGHYALTGWQSTYAALDWLFMGSGVGERYAYQQLNGPRSTFNKESRQLAK